MRRSEINRLIIEAKGFFARHKFHLPPFAFWSPEDWSKKGTTYDVIRKNSLGWDLTDFGSNNFHKIGLLLFTLRNGHVNNPKDVKPYAEKIMIIRKNQVTPMHFHWHKMEDIINRGGGKLVIQLHRAADNNEQEFASEPFQASVDGELRTFKPGELLRLCPGESITITPYLYHKFWAEDGDVLAGEVSMVNDDAHDNRFHEPAGRFPPIDNDEPPIHYLCHEYPPAGKKDIK
jgi:D-lyxose ketol-isomerase